MSKQNGKLPSLSHSLSSPWSRTQIKCIASLPLGANWICIHYAIAGLRACRPPNVMQLNWIFDKLTTRKQCVTWQGWATNRITSILIVKHWEMNHSWDGQRNNYREREARQGQSIGVTCIPLSIVRQFRLNNFVLNRIKQSLSQKIIIKFVIGLGPKLWVRNVCVQCTIEPKIEAMHCTLSHLT